MTCLKYHLLVDENSDLFRYWMKLLNNYNYTKNWKGIPGKTNPDILCTMGILRNSEKIMVLRIETLR